MIATFWFLIKSVLFVIAVTWLLSLGGHITIDFAGYSLSMPFGIFILSAILMIWILSVIGRFLAIILGTPQQLLGHSEIANHKKGMQALAYGLSAVAAGDARMAQYYAGRTTRFLTHDFGLSDLLTGLTQRLNGHDKAAHQSFLKLMNQPETSVLGLKALLQTALDKNDIRYARILATRAYNQNPKQPWVIEQLYNLELRHKNYDSALVLLDRLVRYSDLTKTEIKDEKAIIYMAQGNIEKAYKYDPYSLPIGLMIIGKWIENNKRRKAMNAIKKLWIDNPHPKLIDFWIQCAPKKVMNNPLAMVSWAENLYRLNADNPASALYAGQTILRLGQKDQASRFIKTAMDGYPTMDCARVMHQLDPMGGWMDNIANLKQDQTWVCEKTGRINPKWMPVSLDGYFNSVVWDYPDAHNASNLNQFSIDSLVS